jgi:predicted glycosyltransferase
LFSGVWNVGATIINATLKKALEKFNDVWIPDFGPAGITQPFTAGVKIPHRFVGMLSRFATPANATNDALIVGLVSGPENQRTLFEQTLLAQLTKLMRPSVIVRGLTHTADVRVQNGVELINHLTAVELEELMVSASVIIARSGYSTIMDLYCLGKQQVILVPTPGQTEQEYLGQYVKENKIAVVQSQNEIDLEKAFAMLPACLGFSRSENKHLLKQALDELLI